MNQLAMLRKLLGSIPESDDILQFYLDSAEKIICNLRNSNIVEPEYLEVQVEMAIEMYNKRGAEGQLAHSENGIARTFDGSHVSAGLLSKITPMVRTPFSTVRVI